MKKYLICLSIILISFSIFTVSVKAEDEELKVFDFDVTFTSEGEIVSTYTDQANSLFDNIQPGDELMVNFVFHNDYKDPIDWYMKNMSEAFEQNKGTNAGYEYVLTYSGLTDDIYNSSAVGGDTNSGYDEATKDLDEYFLLQSGFAKGEQQTLSLKMIVDGETSWNVYQSSNSNIQFQFAVEIPPENEEIHKHKIVYIPYTGDTSNITLYVIVEILSLILLLAVLVAYYCYRRKQREA